MANVYNINNSDETIKDKNYQVASVAYVGAAIKKALDLLQNKLMIADSLDIDFSDIIQELPLPSQKSETNEKINAKDITTDSKHLFISEAQLDILRNKPSYIDLENMIMDLRNEIRIDINKSYINLLNNENVLNKLKDFSSMLNNDPDLNSFLDALAAKLDIDSFKEHEKSSMHLNNNDRKAINLLIGFIEAGCADWNASTDDPNFIRNKPEKLPADGGNADTVGGRSVNDLLNHQLDTKVYGTIDNYSADSVDEIIVTKDECDKAITDIKTADHGLFSFKSGNYIFGSFSIASYDKGILLQGAGYSTSFNIEVARFMNNIQVRDLCIHNSAVHINKNCRFDNILFRDCTVYITNAEYSMITSCVFKDCTILVSGICVNNIITNNILINSGKITYYGNSNNIINNNIIC